MNAAYQRSYLVQGMIGAVLVNLILFGLLPGLIRMDSKPSDLESLNAISITRFKPLPPAPDPKPPEPEKPEKQPEKIREAVRPEQRQVRQKQLRLNMPDMDLNIDPRITGGIPMVAPPAPELPETDMDGILDQNAVDVIPVPKFKKNPRYPYRAKRMGLEGVVKLSFTVDKKGIVSDITILESTPPGVFDDAVRKAVSTWKYAPGELMGKQVTTRVTTSVVFKLE